MAVIMLSGVDGSVLKLKNHINGVEKYLKESEPIRKVYKKLYDDYMTTSLTDEEKSS